MLSASIQPAHGLGILWGCQQDKYCKGLHRLVIELYRFVKPPKDLQSTAAMSPLNWWHLLQRTKSVDEGYLILMRWQTEIQQ